MGSLRAGGPLGSPAGVGNAVDAHELLLRLHLLLMDRK